MHLIDKYKILFWQQDSKLTVVIFIKVLCAFWPFLLQNMTTTHKTKTTVNAKNAIFHLQMHFTCLHLIDAFNYEHFALLLLNLLFLTWNWLFR